MNGHSMTGKFGHLLACVVVALFLGGCGRQGASADRAQPDPIAVRIATPKHVRVPAEVVVSGSVETPSAPTTVGLLVSSREDKEAHFEEAVQLLAPIALQVLNEMNMNLLRDTGQLTESGLRRTPDGGLNASWALSWPEQQAAGIEPIVLQAYFGGGFHHPHLRGTTVHDWPLNVFSEEDAAAQLPILRAIASSDLHNLVYLSNYRIAPVVTANRASPRDRGARAT